MLNLLENLINSIIKAKNYGLNIHESITDFIIQFYQVPIGIKSGGYYSPTFDLTHYEFSFNEIISR
jgi:hypothetical protein